MFVTSSDFLISPFTLVNLPEDGTFDDYVNQEVERNMNEVLGGYFYDIMIAAFEALPQDWISEGEYILDDLVCYDSEIWKALGTVTAGTIPIEGIDWQQQDRDKWLKLRDGETFTHLNREFKWVGFTKLIKPLIHSSWIADHAVRINSNGVSVSVSENSETVSSHPVIVRSWSAYRNLLCSSLNSLYVYLYANAVNFDESVPEYSSFIAYLSIEFNDPGAKNIFDI
jgi:hypothetical protein